MGAECAILGMEIGGDRAGGSHDGCHLYHSIIDLYHVGGAMTTHNIAEFIPQRPKGSKN